jgi:hypothetical protein
VRAIAEELDASQQRRDIIGPAMLPVISRDVDHYDSQIYAVCGRGALLPSRGFDCSSDDPEELEPLLPGDHQKAFFGDRELVNGISSSLGSEE